MVRTVVSSRKLILGFLPKALYCNLQRERSLNYGVGRSDNCAWVTYALDELILIFYPRVIYQKALYYRDNSKLCSCGGDRQIFYWDVATGRVIRKFRGHDSEVSESSFSSYGCLTFWMAELSV